MVNLVAASVPGLSADAVRVIDQHGRLLTDPQVSGETDRLDFQTRMEEKLRLQLDKLLTPMLGEGGFSSEIQVELVRETTCDDDLTSVLSKRRPVDTFIGMLPSKA